ncbi:NHLP family bacteriocin export ABC transporter peptidase/permease/ATPase subunit [Streptomyces sp. NPDC006173]|uniref:NHLP family bacteriocin export ABC transporter peptidase/permease/ATPase subunit n=1 Tax=Streptomyces sp. NPDC006173 TaxID=3155349 RepID=UPI0033CEB1A3
MADSATVDPTNNSKDDGSASKPRRSGHTARAKTPTVLQMEAVECGAASLAMVLSSFGRFVPLEELRGACGVSRDGAKASNVLKAARRYGLVAKGVQVSPRALSRLPNPSILFWEFNHFVVLEGFGRRFGAPVVYLNDPAMGQRTVTEEEFENCFTGVVLTMQPAPGFQPGGKRPGLLASLPERLKGSRSLLALAAVASLLLALVGVSAPALTRAFIDEVLLAGDRSVVLPLMIMLSLTTVAIAVLTAVRQSFLLRVRIVASTLTSARFLRHLLGLPTGFFTQRSPADITNRMSSNDEVAATLSRDASGFIVNVLMVLMYAALLWTYNVWLTLLSVTLACLNILALRLVARVRATGVNKVASDQATLLTTSYAGLQMIETLKATGGENEYFRRWAADHAKVVTGRQAIGVPTAMLAVIAPTLTSLNSALILLIGGQQAVQGSITIGTLVAFQALIAAFSAPIAQLTAVAGRLQDFAVDITRLKDVENYATERPRPVETLGHSLRLDGRLVFESVTFGYSPLAAPLIEKLSFSVHPGQQIALVGGSGSGKSTVTRLISGLAQPWSGTVSIDGLPQQDIAGITFAASVAFVDQDIFLFEGTIRDNVTLWDTSVPDEDVVAALKDAAIYDVISARPGGLHSTVDEDGRNFSGGQRQRLEIARALVRSPSVLVLDEATSALDTETERVITDNIRRRGCATIVIAHRLSTIRDSSEIIVLDRGQVIERGSHAELAAAAGPYSTLVQGH